MTDEEFEFERLEVRKLALQLMPLVRGIASDFPRGFGDLGSHRVRSARSIHLNIAGGSGKYRAGAKTVDDATALLKRIAPMLTKLILRWDPKKDP